MTKQNSKSITIRDVAQAAGVSVATVSRYINQTGQIAEETRVRVQKAMDEMKYVPSISARNLATNRTNTIGLLLTEIMGEFFTPMLEGIEKVTSTADYNLLISTSSRPQHGSHLAMGPKNTDGLLVFLDSISSSEIANLYQANFPVVLIYQSPPGGMKIPCVTIENKAASRRIVDHLIEVHNRKRIVFLRGPEDNEDSYWRENGWQQSLIAHNLQPDPALISQGDYNREVARNSIKKMLAEGIPFDAIFSGDDEGAFGVYAALKEAGLRIPEDVSVVGFDDQLLSSYLNPSLTTIHAPTREVGQEAAHQLIQLIRTGSAEPLTLLPTELIIRDSCGCHHS
jgi:DNA-binding LacI/PurR family transcriptional regulator